MATVNVIDSHIAYAESGEGGLPVVFLHGNPTSSHLWRNVTPHIAGQARALAPDLIGMGASGKPDIDYSFADQARYLDAWFEALDLREVVLVGHDWGGALALDRAARHPARVRGVALLETMLKPLSSEEMPPPARSRFEAFRTPGVGEQLVLEENIFIETAFKGGVLNPLSEADVQPYRAPYPTPRSRRPLLAWPRMMPIDGGPADVVARITDYDIWLADSADVPKLLLTFDSSPTLLIGEDMIAWSRENIAALEIEHCGPAGHHAPEDQPDAIGRAIGRWLDAHGLTSNDTGREQGRARVAQESRSA
ncbi:haloalkane dehalogenase [Streptomyces sp. SID13666]|uniref:haloalkane dehalogenase n=1 Tax=Streptomyces TaxID=1883 RepID=UPI0013C19E87|nr:MULTISPECIES: haloalkane dehalogenase [Streptomyces]NEA52835.1 haloalkane dehalogenase [Streptomyces sp. SID13666]NEA69838.1 haloalkane dehalogenase [Streptomyces sp. SID13588]